MQSIVSTEWLQQHLNDPDLIVLYVMGLKRKQQALQEQADAVQIPGSRFFDLKQDFQRPGSELPNTIPTPAQFTAACQALGIRKDSKIVLYDSSGIYASPRAWYLFKVMGHAEVAVLNGGLPAWQAAKLPVESFQKHLFTAGDFQANFQADQFQDTAAIQTNIASQDRAVIDARSEGRFQGTAPEPRAGLSSGHIPGSYNIPFTEVLENGHYKSSEELSAIFNQLDLQQDKLTFSCGSGITACIVLLAAEQVLGDLPKAIYDGSWTEWASTEGLPINKQDQ
ncbi:MAG: sulfurtransferase [Saprospiraceae bacterium]